MNKFIVFIAFVYNFNVKRCKIKTPVRVMRFFHFHNNININPWIPIWAVTTLRKRTKKNWSANLDLLIDSIIFLPVGLGFNFWLRHQMTQRNNCKQTMYLCSKCISYGTLIHCPAVNTVSLQFLLLLVLCLGIRNAMLQWSLFLIIPLKQ